MLSAKAMASTISILIHVLIVVLVQHNAQSALSRRRLTNFMPVPITRYGLFFLPIAISCQVATITQNTSNNNTPSCTEYKRVILTLVFFLLYLYHYPATMLLYSSACCLSYLMINGTAMPHNTSAIAHSII